MSYSFTIGKAVVLTMKEGGVQALVPGVEPCEGEAHKDDWDNGSRATRQPSYREWQRILDVLPGFRSVFNLMEEWVKEYRLPWIPCALYAPYLDALEKEAIQAEANGDVGKAARVFWFVRWSREAIQRYGELAAFETPDEWR